MMYNAVLLQSSGRETLGKGSTVYVAVAEGVSEGQEVNQMKPHVHARHNHLASGTTAGGGTGTVLCLMSCLAFATHVFVLTCICCALPHVPASADTFIRIDCILGAFVQILIWVVPLTLMRWLVTRSLKLLKLMKGR